MTFSPVQKVSVQDLSIAYRVQGHGPDVILIHGWVSSHRMWKLLVDSLAPHFRCWALDLPGFADSAKPEAGWYSIENYECLVLAFADHFQLNEFDLIGHSMGGMIALRLSANQPERVRRLVVINPVVTGRVYFDLKLLTHSRLGQSMLTFGRWFWPWASSDVFRKHQSVHLRRQGDEWSQAEPQAAVATAKAIGKHDLTRLLPSITAPTMILLGKRDLAAPNSEGRFAAKHIPQAQLITLPGGHLLTDDLPEVVQQHIADFLRLAVAVDEFVKQ